MEDSRKSSKRSLYLFLRRMLERHRSLFLQVLALPLEHSKTEAEVRGSGRYKFRQNRLSLGRKTKSIYEESKTSGFGNFLVTFCLHKK